MIKKTIKKMFPPDTKTGKSLKKLAAKIGLAKPIYFNIEYENWINQVEPAMFLPIVATKKSEAPLFSIVIPFFNTPDRYLYPLIDSIINQSFNDWELIIGDGSNDSERASTIKKVSEQDERIKYHKFTKNTDISGNTNQALQCASGKYIVFCDHDDILSLYALNEVASVISNDNQADIIYSDEDKIGDNGIWRHSPFFKPDWSPHLFTYTNYLNHLTVIRRSLVENVNGLRSELNGSQDYDLLLRVISSKNGINIQHISKVLYHWREAVGSTAAEFSNKSYAFKAGKRALQEFLDRQNINGITEIVKDRPGYYKQLLKPCDIKNVAIVAAISDDMAENNMVADTFKSCTKSDLLKISYLTIRKSELNSLNTDGYDAVIEINIVAYPEKSDWIDQMIGVLELHDVKAVSPRIISPNKERIFDMGIVYSYDGMPINLYKGLWVHDATAHGSVEWVRDVDDLTGNIKCYKTKAYNKIKQYSVIWSCVDFVAYPVLGCKTLFNNNLLVNDKNEVTVRGNK
jgi:glycosyltransferase involved in cell wall biosynthesis